MFHGIELMSMKLHCLLVSYSRVTLTAGTKETQKPGAMQVHTSDLMSSFNSFQASVSSGASHFDTDLYEGIKFLL